MMEVVADSGLKRRERSRANGTEVVFPAGAVELCYLHVAVDAEVRQNATRFDHFDPETELRPQHAAPRPLRRRPYERQRQLQDPGAAAYRLRRQVPHFQSVV